jgi:Transposase DDE domain
MSPKYDISAAKEQEGQALSQEIISALEAFLLPLVLVLDTLLDKRLVRTLMACCVAILRFRNSLHGLLLSELGSYLDGYRGLSVNAPAGTKRLSNLLRSLKWSFLQIDQFLLTEADKEVKRLREQGRRVLCIWDSSVIEKPESEKLEGLGPVVSSKAKRRNRSKKGLVFNFPPKKAITVAGMQWSAAVICGMSGLVKVAAMSWWTTKGDYATKLRTQEEGMLRQCVRQWGNLLLNIFDRGYGTGPWLQVLDALRQRFVIRWKAGLNFIDANGAVKKLWQIGQGKKYRGHKQIRDSHTGLKTTADIWWAPVRHVDYSQQLYLVKARVRNQVCYLITNEVVTTEEAAWEIFFAYRRRWQVETSFRYGKSELAMESPRLWLMENRLKLLGIVTLVYAFLLHLLHSNFKKLVETVLRYKCHRTGKWTQKVIAPLYRLRWAISRLLDDFHPLLGSIFPPDLATLQALAAFKG